MYSVDQIYLCGKRFVAAVPKIKLTAPISQSLAYFHVCQWLYLMSDLLFKFLLFKLLFEVRFWFCHLFFSAIIHIKVILLSGSSCFVITRDWLTAYLKLVPSLRQALTLLIGMSYVLQEVPCWVLQGSKVWMLSLRRKAVPLFIVLFYRPLPDSWRNFKTTTCPPFHTHSLPSCLRPSVLLPTPWPCSPGQRQVRGSTVSLSLFLFPLRRKTDTSSVAGDSHLRLTSHRPPPAPPRPVVNSSATPPPCPSVTSLPPVCLHWQATVCVSGLNTRLLK